MVPATTGALDEGREGDQLFSVPCWEEIIVHIGETMVTHPAQQKKYYCVIMRPEKAVPLAMGDISFK